MDSFCCRPPPAPGQPQGSKAGAGRPLPPPPTAPPLSQSGSRCRPAIQTAQAGHRKGKRCRPASKTKHPPRRHPWITSAVDRTGVGVDEHSPPPPSTPLRRRPQSAAPPSRRRTCASATRSVSVYNTARRGGRVLVDCRQRRLRGLHGKCPHSRTRRPSTAADQKLTSLSCRPAPTRRTLFVQQNNRRASKSLGKARSSTWNTWLFDNAISAAKV